MNQFTLYGLMTLGVVFLGLPTQAQTKVTVTTSTNAVPTPVSSPMQPDTLTPNRPGMALPQGDDKDTRLNRKQRRKNRGKSGSADTTNATDYRTRVLNNGTASNNSNTTNYNSQNAVAPATGVNAAPAGQPMRNSTTPSTGAGSNNGSVSVGSTMGTTTQAGSTAVSKAPTPGNVASPDRNDGKANRSKTLNVSDFVAGSPNYTTLQNALQTATLDKTLKGTGPFTVFAPTNEAFQKLPAQTQQVLLEGRNLEVLKALLSYHVVSGEIDAAELTSQIKAGNGKATLPTVSGHMLTARASDNGRLSLTDEQGNTVTIETPAYYQTNGVVYGVGHVLLPTGGTAAFR